MIKFTFVLFFIGISFAGRCQDKELFTDIGVIAGAGTSSGRDDLFWDASLGIILGIETSFYTISEKSSIQTGIVFSRVGGPNYQKTITTTNPYGYGDSFRIWSDGTASLFYFNVPLFYRFKTRGGFYLEGGLQTGFLLNAKTNNSSDDGVDIKDKFKTFELNLPIGLGYWFKNRLGIGIMTYTGLTNVNSDKVTEEIYDLTHRSSMLTGVIRYRFN